MSRALTPGTPVRHLLHAELVGQVEARHENFPTTKPPYAVTWDNPALAARRLGPYYAFIFPEMLRPIGRLRRLYIGMRQGLLAAVETGGEDTTKAIAEHESFLMLVDGNDTPAIVSDLDAEEINVIRSFITEIRRRHVRRRAAGHMDRGAGPPGPVAPAADGGA